MVPSACIGSRAVAHARLIRRSSTGRVRSTRAVVGSAASEAVADEPVQTDALLGGGEG